MATLLEETSIGETQAPGVPELALEPLEGAAEKMHDGIGRAPHAGGHFSGGQALDPREQDDVPVFGLQRFDGRSQPIESLVSRQCPACGDFPSLDLRVHRQDQLALFPARGLVDDVPGDRAQPPEERFVPGPPEVLEGGASPHEHFLEEVVDGDSTPEDFTEPSAKDGGDPSPMALDQPIEGGPVSALRSTDQNLRRILMFHDAAHFARIGRSRLDYDAKSGKILKTLRHFRRRAGRDEAFIEDPISPGEMNAPVPSPEETME
jgi:hypothetical protein